MVERALETVSTKFASASAASAMPVRRQIAAAKSGGAARASDCRRAHQLLTSWGV